MDLLRVIPEERACGTLDTRAAYEERFIESYGDILWGRTMIQVAILLASLSSTSGGDAKVDSKIEARWRSEYPAAAAELEEIARNFWAVGRLSFRWNNGSTTTTKMLKVAASGDKKLFIRDEVTRQRPNSPNESEESEVKCETAEYRFELKKDPLASHFIIGDYGTYEENDESRFQYWFKNFARNATVYYGTSFLQRMRHPSFVLKSIEVVNQDGGELVRIGYSYEGKYDFETGFVDLDTGKKWAIQRVEVECRNKLNSTSPPYLLRNDVQYKKVDDAQFFPYRKEFFGRSPKPEVYEHAVIEFDDVWLGPPPDEMFRLTEYGLPDIPLRPLPRASIFTFYNPLLWLTLAASIVSFVLLRRPERTSLISGRSILG